MDHEEYINSLPKERKEKIKKRAKELMNEHEIVKYICEGCNFYKQGVPLRILVHGSYGNFCSTICAQTRSINLGGSNWWVNQPYIYTQPNYTYFGWSYGTGGCKQQ